MAPKCRRLMDRVERTCVFGGCFFFFQAEDGIRDYKVTGVQTCALPIYDEQWRLYFGPVHLATWNARTKRFVAPEPQRSEGLPASPPAPLDPDSSPQATVKKIGRASCRERV